eukprot:jgi/Chrzof1/424/Cz01g15120.t1
MQVYNFCLLGFVLIGVKIGVKIKICRLHHAAFASFELTAQLKYLWPNLRWNSKSNPLFKTIQIDLYDPLRIQHESLPHHHGLPNEMHDRFARTHIYGGRRPNGCRSVLYAHTIQGNG